MQKAPTEFEIKRRCDSVAFNAVQEVMNFMGRPFPITDNDAGVAYLVSELLRKNIATIEVTENGYKPSLASGGAVDFDKLSKSIDESLHGDRTTDSGQQSQTEQQ